MGRREERAGQECRKKGRGGGREVRRKRCKGRNETRGIKNIKLVH